MWLRLSIAAAAAAAFAGRQLIRRRVERSCAARLPVGPDGLIRGAAPINLKGDPDRALLLVHGCGDTPQALCYLAAHLHESGYSVYAPLLPGHGRTLPDFAASQSDDWINEVRRAYRWFVGRHERVGVIGLSMGGALSAILAAEEQDVAALVLVAPYMSVPRQVRAVARYSRFMDALVPYFPGLGEDSVRDASERDKSLAYGYFTAGNLRSLVRVVDLARESLPFVTAPALMIQSEEDNRIPPEEAQWVFDELGSEHKRLVWTRGNRHVITVDYGRVRVFELAAEWIARHMGNASVRRTGGNSRAQG